MTPLDIDILLHYHCSASDYRDGDLTAPAVRDSIAWALHEGLLECRTDSADATYRTTSRGDALVLAMCRMALPTQQWVIPRDAP